MNDPMETADVPATGTPDTGANVADLVNQLKDIVAQLDATVNAEASAEGAGSAAEAPGSAVTGNPMSKQTGGYL